MPKIPYKVEKTEGDDEDYEIVSFEDFCDKSPGSKTDLLNLNDNINYRLCYESDNKSTNYADKYGEPSNRDGESHTETSLNGSKNLTFKRKLSNSFAPFGRHNGKTGRAPLFSGVIPKSRSDSDSGPREGHRYQRFAGSRGWARRAQALAGAGPGALGVALVCALCVAAWWAASGALGGAWGEEHYRKLWERAHPDNTKKPPTPITYEKILPEFRYHDHNNLSTKNKSNGTEFTRRKTDLNKKSFLDRTPEELKNMCANVTDDMRFDCFPQANANENDCIKRGCCWRGSDQKNLPYCFYPPEYDTFSFLNMTEDKHSIRAYYERARPSGYPDDFMLARMDFKYMSDDVLQIKIYDPENKRFEPPVPEIAQVSKPLSRMKYRVEMHCAAVGFKVVRNSDNVTIFNTQDVGGLILSDKFLQISAVLSTPYLFGLGERRGSFRLDMNWQTVPLFNRDRMPTEHQNLYGTHPFFLATDPQEGFSFGILLLNSNAMDIVLQPTPAVTYRTIGGVLDFYVLLGPTPIEVYTQYTELVGRTFMPPYWALGFHLCKYNYLSLNTTRQVWKSNRDAGIPFDVQWNDLDYMLNGNDFTYDTVNFAGLPAFVDELHKEGMHYMILIDPGISGSEKRGTYPPYERGLEMNIFVKNGTNQPFVGKVWNRESTVYPDFTHPNATQYWVDMMSDFHQQVKYDGAWIDMNEPSNFVDGIKEGHCRPEQLPYLPHTADPYLRAHTLCMDASHYAGDHYDVHNLYGLTEAIATNFALSDIRGKRPFIISRSTFVGSGAYTGHWSGDIASEWHDMRMTIPELLNFNLFGVPMMGADICGFAGNTTVELCKRWMQLGAFYPFSRNHNSDSSIPQDPVSLGPTVVEASRKALLLRYTILPYYYTLFWDAHVNGLPVIRPLLFLNPQDTSLYDVDEQFLIGPHLMVTPILQEGATSVSALFPGPEDWYDFVTGRKIGCDVQANVDEDHILAVRGGSVIPLQRPAGGAAVSTGSARSGPLQLLAAPGRARRADGHLYWDDGDGLNSYNEKKFTHLAFRLTDNELLGHVVWWGHGVPTLSNITVLDQPSPVVSATVNGVAASFTYDEDTKVLCIYNLNLSLDKYLSAEWRVKSS